MNSTIQKVVNVALSYVMHLAVAAVAAIALHFGWHIHVPVIPVSLASFAGLFSLRTAAEGVADSWHRGRLGAELQHAAKTDLTGLLDAVFNAVDGHDNKPASTPASDTVFKTSPTPKAA